MTDALICWFDRFNASVSTSSYIRSREMALESFVESRNDHVTGDITCRMTAHAISHDNQ